MNGDLVKASRFLSLVLRHKPHAIGLELAPAGWADIDTLIARAAAHGVDLTHDALVLIVAGNDKQRFALDDTGRRIRASQGHSIDVDLGLAPRVPPALLFHGTARASLPAIRAEGLTPQRRRHVHLSRDPTTAHKVGSRHGKSVVLGVRAGAMQAAGKTFYLSANGVWLTAAVAPAFIDFPAA